MIFKKKSISDYDNEYVVIFSFLNKMMICIGIYLKHQGYIVINPIIVFQN